MGPLFTSQEAAEEAWLKGRRERDRLLRVIKEILAMSEEHTPYALLNIHDKAKEALGA